MPMGTSTTIISTPQRSDASASMAAISCATSGPTNPSSSSAMATQPRL
jgi:hypothetical protein